MKLSFMRRAAGHLALPTQAFATGQGRGGRQIGRFGVDAHHHIGEDRLHVWRLPRNGFQVVYLAFMTNAPKKLHESALHQNPYGRSLQCPVSSQPWEQSAGNALVVKKAV